MLFSSLALLAIQLKAQGLNPSQVLFADALVTLSPFDYRHVPKLDSKESMDLDQCIDNSSDSESDCSVLIGTTKGQINSPSKKLKVATPTRPVKVRASPRSPATTAPLNISCSSWPPSLGFFGPSSINENAASRFYDGNSVIELLSDTESELEDAHKRTDKKIYYDSSFDSDNDKKPRAKSPNSYIIVRSKQDMQEEDNGEPKAKPPPNECCGAMTADDKQLLAYSGGPQVKDCSVIELLSDTESESEVYQRDCYRGCLEGTITGQSLRRQRTKDAKILNDLFPYDKSKFPVEWMQRPPKKTCMKENDRSYLMYPERMGTVLKGTKGSFRGAGGKVMSDGMTMSITTNSFAKVMFMLLRKLDTKKARNMVTLDLGSGQGIPSILMGQFFGDGCLGLHIGIEQDPGLVASSRYNAKLVATKALVNFNRGYFHKQYIQNHGETEHTCFPNALFVHGDICDITSLKPFDVLYGFDAANCPKSKRHVADLWNQANPENRNSHGMSKCPNPKHLLSNSNFQEMLDLGFQDIVPYSQVEVRFSGSNEGRVTYHYGRKSLQEQGKNNQTYSYENPLPVDEVCPIFQSAWKDYLAGRSQMEKASRTCPCNQAILDRLLSEEYYIETLPKRTDRKRISRSQEDNDREGGLLKTK